MLDLAGASDQDAMLAAQNLRRLVVDTHTRPDGGVELVGLYLRPPSDPDNPQRRGTPVALHVGAKLAAPSEPDR